LAGALPEGYEPVVDAMYDPSSSEKIFHVLDGFRPKKLPKEITAQMAD
jgi:hypothetical protein